MRGHPRFRGGGGQPVQQGRLAQARFAGQEQSPPAWTFKKCGQCPADLVALHQDLTDGGPVLRLAQGFGHLHGRLFALHRKAAQLLEMKSHRQPRAGGLAEHLARLRVLHEPRRQVDGVPHSRVLTAQARAHGTRKELARNDPRAGLHAGRPPRGHRQFHGGAYGHLFPLFKGVGRAEEEERLGALVAHVDLVEDAAIAASRVRQHAKGRHEPPVQVLLTRRLREPLEGEEENRRAAMLPRASTPAFLLEIGGHGEPERVLGGFRWICMAPSLFGKDPGQERAPQPVSGLCLPSPLPASHSRQESGTANRLARRREVLGLRGFVQGSARRVEIHPALTVREEAQGNASVGRADLHAEREGAGSRGKAREAPHSRHHARCRPNRSRAAPAWEEHGHGIPAEAQDVPALLLHDAHHATEVVVEEACQLLGAFPAHDHERFGERREARHIAEEYGPLHSLVQDPARFLSRPCGQGHQIPAGFGKEGGKVGQGILP